eukprot:Skav228141  [mRNA]  locus=scaffold2683:55686:56831:+ [translate_table: standard]
MAGPTYVSRSGVLSLTLVSAMSFSDSKPVFKDRCNSAGLASAVSDLVVAAGFDTLSKFAFCSSYVPGSGDETAFVKTVKTILSREPSLGELASFRKLLHEAYSLVTAEMKQQLERSEDVQTRKLTQPERADLYERQVKRLTGLTLTGPLEPSDALVDVYCGIYDANRLRFVPWEKYTSKEAEIDRENRAEHMFAIDSNGKLKVENKQAEATADTSTEIMLQYALQRRGLSMDQANLLDYTKHQAWVDRLIRARLQLPPPGYNKPTFRQLLEADKKLFEVLADCTRSGVQTTSTGRPLHAQLEKATNVPEVMRLPQPLMSKSSDKHEDKVSAPASSARAAPYPAQAPSRAVKGKGKGKSKSSFFSHAIGVGRRRVSCHNESR